QRQARRGRPPPGRARRGPDDAHLRDGRGRPPDDPPPALRSEARLTGGPRRRTGGQWIGQPVAETRRTPWHRRSPSGRRRRSRTRRSTRAYATTAPARRRPRGSPTPRPTRPGPASATREASRNPTTTG